MRHLIITSLFAASIAFAQDKASFDLVLEPPTINTAPGAEYDDQVRPGNMIIGIKRTPKGRLWAAWVGNGDSPNGFFMLATSEDGGKSWSKPRVHDIGWHDAWVNIEGTQLPNGVEQDIRYDADNLRKTFAR